MGRLPLLAVLLCLSIPVMAQTTVGDPAGAGISETNAADSTSDSAKEPVKETIVVTAPRSPRTLSEVPVSTTVIREEDLRSTPAIAVSDVLRTIPGVNMPLGNEAATNVSGQRISMHGLGGTRALVLLDGIPLHDPYYGTVEWQK